LVNDLESIVAITYTPFLVPDAGAAAGEALAGAVVALVVAERGPGEVLELLRGLSSSKVEAGGSSERCFLPLEGIGDTAAALLVGRLATGEGAEEASLHCALFCVAIIIVNTGPCL